MSLMDWALPKIVPHTVNPFPILANSPLQAGAYNYPDVINRQQEANGDVDL